MIRSKSFPACLLIAASALPAAAASGPYIITAERVAEAVSGNGVTVSADQVTLLANVVASVADPELKVKSIDPSGERRAVARIECANPQQCLPFLVTLRVDQNPVPLTPPGKPAPPPGRPTVPVIHAGSRATLLLEGPHVHITLPVIPLENGAKGQTVRVTSLDRQQVYTVRVVNEGILEGNLR